MLFIVLFIFNIYNMAQSLNMVLLNIGYAKHNADWNWKDTHSLFARLYSVQTGIAQVGY
jgi:hypothetical protein